MPLKDHNKNELFGGGGGPTFKPKPRQDALGNKIPEPEEELVILEKELQEVKVAFEQFFMGLNRKSPTRRRDVLGERLRRVKTADSKMSVMVRYRFDHLTSKYQAYERMWARTLSEIEAGTYKRDLFKAKLRKRGSEATEAPHPEDASRPAEPARAAAPAPQPPAAAPPPPLSEGQMKALHAAYMLARTRTNESTEGITVQALSKSLLKQVPELMKKYDCKAIDFKVIIKDNRAILKAVPRR